MRPPHSVTVVEFCVLGVSHKCGTKHVEEGTNIKAEMPGNGNPRISFSTGSFHHHSEETRMLAPILKTQFPSCLSANSSNTTHSIL